MNKPPLDIEQAINLILATPSMFSKRSEGQREFGKLIVKEFYSKLIVDNRADPNDYKYLINLFSLISSTVRAFGVQRDIFETKWKTINEIKQYELNSARKIIDYSPFRGGKFWERLLGLFTSLFGGGSLGLLAGIFIKINNYQILFIAALILIGWTVGIIVLDFGLQKIKDRRINLIIKKYPIDLNEEWKKETIPQYKKNIKNFLISAIKIREEFYPELQTLKNIKIFDSNIYPHIQFNINRKEIKSKLNKGEIESYIDEIIERHFAF